MTDEKWKMLLSCAAGYVLSDLTGTKTKQAETKPLWHAEDQALRLAELTSNAPKVKEAPLRRDVRSLGRLLGDVLKEQAGEALFAAVEEIRQLAIEFDRRRPGPAAGLPHDEGFCHLLRADKSCRDQPS